MKLLTVLALGMSISSCGEGLLKTEKKESSGSTNYSYEYTENGCNTGKRSFNSKDSYCKGLMDDSANNYCARSMREETYNKNCN